MIGFVEDVKRRLLSAGLNDAEEVAFSVAPSEFGDAVVVFRVGTLLLRFTLERGQEFLDLASSADPSVFHQFDDVDIAMGWKSVAEVLAKREPEDIRAVLARIKNGRPELVEAFSGERERFTRARVERAARDRGEAFADRLRAKRQE